MGFANWWDQTIVPRIVRCGCAVEPIMDLRREVVPLAHGAVFELGCGGGLNQRFYDTARVTSFSGIDPSPKLLEFAGRQVARKDWPAGIPADIRHGYGEDIPFADNSFDTVVCTFTLCSVNDHARVLSELQRILKPGGTFLYLEHGRSPDPSLARWQERIDPLWSKLLGNCHLSRPVHAAVSASGFVTRPMGARYMDSMAKIAGWVEWGEATRPAATQG
jgi:SAM-dependent methyltransferase